MAMVRSLFTSNNAPIAAKFRSFASGLRSIEDQADSNRVALGFKGLLADWDYDVGLLYNSSRVSESPTAGYFSQSGLAELFDSGVVNPFGPQTAAVQSQIDALGFNQEAFHSVTSLTELDAKASRQLMTLPAGDLSLADLYAPVTQGVSSVLGNLDPIRCNFNPDLPECSSGQVAVLNGGNPNLKPEKSENFTLGLVWEPTMNSSVSLDYYKIRLRDTITPGGLGANLILSSAAFESQYSQYVVRGAPTAAGDPGPILFINQTNQNLFNTVTDGVDIDTHWRFRADETGRWTAGLNGTYIHRYDSQQPDGTYLGLVDNVGNAGSLISRWRYRATLNWDTEHWNTTLAYNFQLGYRDTPAGLAPATDANGNPIGPFVPAVRTTDAQTSYIGIPNWVITVGARNLFNDFPPYTNLPGTNPFQTGYDPSYSDSRGRFMYATVTYKWK